MSWPDQEKDEYGNVYERNLWNRPERVEPDGTRTPCDDAYTPVSPPVPLLPPPPADTNSGW